MFIAVNTRQPAVGSRTFELAEYFEMVFIEILPSVNVAGFLRAGHNYCVKTNPFRHPIKRSCMPGFNMSNKQ